MAAISTIEALDGSDLVALAQCMALDATVFPHPSVPLVPGGGAPRVWVARSEPNGAVVAFLATMRRANKLEIVGIAVDPAHRRSGIARALVRTAVDSARERGLAMVTLHVSTANESALTLYESEGFLAHRHLRRFYSPARFGNGGDAYEMVLRLRATGFSARRPPP